MGLVERVRAAVGPQLRRVGQELTVRAVNAAYVPSLLPAWRRFAAAARDPERAQATRLRALVTANAETAFGREHRFARIDSAAAFRRHVPVRSGVALEPWLQRVAAGEPGVLTTEPVRVMERTSGSTRANKLIPYTDTLLDEFAAATGPWIFNLYTSHPRLVGTRSYWSITPVTRGRERTSGGIPIGFDDDTEYFGPIKRWALRQLLTVPASVARITDIVQWRHETIRALLMADDLGLISVWSPTFLTLLMEHLDRELDTFLADLPPGRAGAIRQALDATGGYLTGECVWPRLGLISCWADGCSQSFIPQLRRWFPRTRVQPKGLLATEGAVSFPLADQPGAALSVAGHFLELVDLDHPDREPLLAHELRVGGVYSPLLSTGGGLYRYALSDMVRCVGFYRNTPLVRFVGKLDQVTDLCGEKLSETVASAALAAAFDRAGMTAAFALLSPVLSPGPHYRLYVETDADDGSLEEAAQELEERLRANCNYGYCRKLGQLGPLQVVRVKDGWARYQDALVVRGQRLGEIKPTHLDAHGVAHAVLEGGLSLPLERYAQGEG